jgi:predicted lipoprotein with Yx(FWY)xxD motif
VHKAAPVLLAFCATAIGCGDNDMGASDRMSPPMSASVERTAGDSTATAKRKGAVVRVVDSQFGRVIADRSGEAFYLFDKEKARKSECYGECAKAWPPMLTEGKPRAGRGARPSLLGTTRRRDGKLQVTYAGHPLYYYQHDAPGKILCHDVAEFGGLWLVVKPNGRAAAG